MPPDGPNPYAYFSLVPLNDEARAVLEHPDNAHLVSIVEEERGIRSGLPIGRFIGSGSSNMLAVIGRTGDIEVEGSDISQKQCSFELHEGNQTEIVLQDWSSSNSTKLLGDTAIGFESGRAPRRVVIDEAINLVFGFGGAPGDRVQFRIVWHPVEVYKGP